MSPVVRYGLAYLAVGGSLAAWFEYKEHQRRLLWSEDEREHEDPVSAAHRRENSVMGAALTVTLWPLLILGVGAYAAGAAIKGGT